MRLRYGGWHIAAACLCDARERDAEELSLADGRALVPVQSAITSVRLLPDPGLAGSSSG